MAITSPGPRHQNIVGSNYAGCNPNMPEDEHLFRKELLKIIDPLFYFAYSLTHKHADAEDLVQESVMRALKNYQQFTKGSNLKAWVFTIIRNSYINSYRKHKREPKIVDFEDATLYIPADDSDDFFNDLDSENIEQMSAFEDQLDDSVKQALDELQPQFKQIFLLAVVDNLTYNEIAEIIDIPVGTVMSRLFRARKMMYNRLKYYADELGILKDFTDDNEVLENHKLKDEIKSGTL